MLTENKTTELKREYVDDYRNVLKERLRCSERS